jgi:hypothetical protein
MCPSADYSRIRIPRRALPLTLSLSPSGGEGIEMAPSPRERVGVRVRVCSRIIRASGRPACGGSFISETQRLTVKFQVRAAGRRREYSRPGPPAGKRSDQVRAPRCVRSASRTAPLRPGQVRGRPRPVGPGCCGTGVEEAREHAAGGEVGRRRQVHEAAEGRRRIGRRQHRGIEQEVGGAR